MTGGTSPFEDLDYWSKLIAYTEDPSRDGLQLLEFARLQHLNLIHLQNELALIKSNVFGHRTTSKGEMEKLTRLLREYATAIRDLDYLSHLPPLRDPKFILDNRILLENAFPNMASRPGAPYDSACRTLRRDAVRNADAVREFLRKHLHRRLAWSADERKADMLGFSKRLPPLIYSPMLDRIARFLIAVGGGCLVVVPMLVMSFDPSQTKSLLVVTVAVVLFALVMSLAFQTDNKDTLTATATYAAVLVVFIGTSGTGLES
ncbi:hypothetical protein QBC40DRAFT_185669 [Triangularia verruculosa]|uniref:DUF6594 domain-containing protein n=1 Tax=Triangularia verruculosa TaxID=2587418 RepID=A0AAN6XCV4_9PEZI|nr:hypothetical protein QBC40DRAFT_185669 [Triangularia verruculosa]